MHFDFQQRRVKPDAIIAFLLGVVAAYLLIVGLRFGGGRIFLTLIVTVVGGLWYQWRKVL